MKQLPRSLDDIRGLRAARWIRESTAGQYDRFGPASQREQQDRFIERYGLVDTGRVFQVAHSGTTVWRSPTMTQMLAEAKAGGFDLLLAGYSDRWQRNLRRTLELLEDHLHPAGVALVMCDRRILSSDPRDWDELVAESAGAERYSRRLSERITEGYGAKFDRRTTRAAMRALGSGDRRSRPTPWRSTRTTIGMRGRPVRTLCTRHLERRAARRRDRPRSLAHPLHPDEPDLQRLDTPTPGPNQTRRPAPWRANPPVSDELWARVEEVRRAKSRAADRAGEIEWICWAVCSTACAADASAATDGRRTDGTASSIPSRVGMGYRRPDFRPRPGRSPILAQMGGIELDDGVIARVVAASARRSVRSPSTVRGSSARCASLPSTTSAAG